MEETPEKIVVLEKFGDQVSAGLAKSKLDAYGVPCFLTNENLVALYPMRDTFQQARLHVFESDVPYAREILSDVVESSYRCPHCNSNRVELAPSKHSKGWPTIFAAFSFLFTPTPHNVFQCLDCGRELDYPE